MMFSSTATPIRLALGVFLALLGGVALVLAFPPYEIWPLAFVGYVPVLIAHYRVLPPRFAALGAAIGITVWLQGYLGPVFAPLGTFMVWLPLLIGLITLLTGQRARAFHERTGYRWFVFKGVVDWLAIELIRLFIPVMGTWAFIAYPLYRQIWLIQPVTIFGIFGMSALVMLVNYALALALMAGMDRQKLFMATALGRDSVRRQLALAAGVVLCWVGLSLVLWRQPLASPSQRVAAIQPALKAAEQAGGTAVERAAYLQASMVEQSRAAAAAGARFIVWPEGTLSWDPQLEDRLKLRELTAQTGTYLALGYGINTERGRRNEATIIDPQGNYLGVFGKDHPVVFAGETSLSRGNYPVYPTSLGVLGTIICYDLDFTDTARKLASRGAQLIGVPSNDWGSIADKHYTHVVFRAVENRIAMVKADGGYDSAIIDPYGTIRALAVHPESGAATLVADVQLGDGRGTIATRLGDWVGWLALAMMVGFVFVGPRLGKREEESSQGESFAG